MRALPIESTQSTGVHGLPAGDTRPYVGTKDITMMYSVVDIAGLNRISKRVLANAAGARDWDGRNAAAISAGTAADRSQHVRQYHRPASTVLAIFSRQQGSTVLVFHATGAGRE